MGVVFTVLFAIGLILVEQAAHHVDIHPDHVLFGAAELVPLYTVDFLGVTVPRGVLTLTIVLIVNLTVVILLFKELRLVTFDPALATTLGINARWMNYLLMALVALTAMASFEVVGSILVIGMIIVPGAIAHLLTRRLVPFLLVSVAVAVVAAVGGHVAALSRDVMMSHPAIDFVCQNEGVYTISSLLKTNLSDRLDMVPGLGYRHNGEVYLNAPSPIVTKEDLPRELPGVAWDLLPMDRYRTALWHSLPNQCERSPFAAVYTSLGCPMKCSFCMIWQRGFSVLGSGVYYPGF